jgi:hypothetical protein
VSLAGGSAPHGALLTGTTLTIARDLAVTQGVDFVNNDGADAEVAEGTLDKLTLLVQELVEGFGRTLRVDVADEPGSVPTLPSFVGRAGKFLGFDASGVPTVAATLSGVFSSAVVGQIPFGFIGGTFGQDANLFWDNTNKRLGIGNAAPTVALDVTGSGKFSTSVVTPLVGRTDDGAFDVQVNGAVRWRFQGSAGNYDLYPGTSDLTESIGAPGARIKQVFTPIVDSGTTGSLLLRTNNGTTQVQILDQANAVAIVTLRGSTTGLDALVLGSGETNTGLILSSSGTGSISVRTRANGVTQFQVLDTVSATRNITVTGSNGGNPTISTTAGSLAITPDTTIAGGLNPNFTSAETAIGAAPSNTTVSHGLSAVPRMFEVALRNKTAELGFSIGDEIKLGVSGSGSDGGADFTIYADSSVVGIIQTNLSVTVIRKDTQVSAAITTGNWKYVVRAWK